MAMLAVDIGNTTTRMAAFDGASVSAYFSWPTRQLESDAVLRALSSVETPGTLWIASVAPYAEPALVDASERLGRKHRFIRSGKDDIIANRLATLSATGVDRLLSAMAAGILHEDEIAGGGYSVIQCGSAATVDFVDGDGVFEGGFILPGPAMWLSGLAGAALLPDLSGAAPDWTGVGPGDNTRDAILHGMARALPYAVAETALRAGVPGRPIFVTGGWGGVVAQTLGGGVRHIPDLLLHGIRLFAERNEHA
jgi:pantothenate kinase, type III